MRRQLRSSETDEIKALIERYAYLEGKAYVDDDNGRLYTVTEVYWDKGEKALCTMRVSRDGLPPEESDEYPYIVVGGAAGSNIVELVRQYDEQHQTGGEAMTEARVLEAQREDIGLTEIWRKIDEQEMDSKGLKEVEYNNRTYLLWPDMALRLKEEVDMRSTVTSIRQMFQPIILPVMWQEGVLQQFHDELGHPGAARMIYTVGKYYTWKGMRKDITTFATTCSHCQKRKSATQVVQNPLVSVYPRMFRPFDRCHMDLFGELPETAGGYKYVLVFKCALTKWVEYFPLRSKEAKEIAECYVDEIVMRHCAPRILITDAGNEFNNRILKAICKMLRTKKITTSPYNPRADGLAENQVKTCKDMLSSYCNVYQNDWDQYLSVVAHHYRTTYNDAIGMTPYKALYGRECTKLDTMWIADVLESNEDIGEYAEDMALAMIAVWESLGAKVYENSIRKQKQHIRLHGIQRMHQYKVGDLALIRKVPEAHFVSEVKVDKKQQKHKIRAALQNRYRGPYKVVRIISDKTIVCLIKGREQHIAYKNMKPYYMREALKDMTAMVRKTVL